MKKRILSALLFGALITASTSTLVSCKDYDDDITSLRTEIDKLSAESALYSTKTELQKEIDALKNLLEQEVGKVGEANSASIAALEARLNTAQAAMDAINVAVKENASAISGNATSIEALMNLAASLQAVDESLANDIVKAIETAVAEAGAKAGESDSEIAAKIEAVKNDIATLAAKADLEEQIKALESLKEALAVTESATGTNLGAIEALIAEIEALKTTLSPTDPATPVVPQDNPVSGNSETIKALQAKMSEVSSKVDSVNTSVNTINVLVAKALRGLVFIPDAYFEGIEANYMNIFRAPVYWRVQVENNDKGHVSVDNTNKYIPTAEMNADKQEVKGYYDYNRYDSIVIKNGNKVIPVVWSCGIAKYHMNPSSATINPANINILDKDKVVLTRSQYDEDKNRIDVNTTDSTKAYAQAGVLYVPLKIHGAADELINTVEKLNNSSTESNQDLDQNYAGAGKKYNLLTVFATQYKLDQDGEEAGATVTSDYAALISDVKDVTFKIALRNNVDQTIDGVKNAGVKNPRTWSSASPCTHADADCNHHVMQTVREARENAPTYGIALDQKVNLYELVALHMYKFDAATGRQLAEGIDSYDDYLNWVMQVAHGNEMNFDFTLTKYERVANNGENESKYVSLSGDNGRYLTVNKKADGKMNYEAIGKTPLVRVEAKDRDGQVLDYGYIKFCIEDCIYNYLVDNKTVLPLRDLGKLISNDWFVENDVNHTNGTYEAHLQTLPAAKYPTFWQGISDSTFTAKDYMSGKDYTVRLWNEFDTNMSWTAADRAGALKLTKKLADLFQPGTFRNPATIGAKFYDFQDTEITPYIKTDSCWFVFSAKPGKDTFNGSVTMKNGSRKSYKVEVRNNGYELWANEIGTLNYEKIAELTPAKEVELQYITLNNASDFAKDLLNAYGRKESCNEFLAAFLSVKLSTSCVHSSGIGDCKDHNANCPTLDCCDPSHESEHCTHFVHNPLCTSPICKGADYYVCGTKCHEFETPEQYAVRFIRPLNYGADESRTRVDAAAGAEVIIDLDEIMNFWDWQDQWSQNMTKAPWHLYYGIDAITLPGVSLNNNLTASNPFADMYKTSYGNENASDLTCNNNLAKYPQLEFVYESRTGVDGRTHNVIVYSNNQGEVTTFNVEIPVQVKYYWGTLNSKLVITIHTTY